MANNITNANKPVMTLKQVETSLVGDIKHKMEEGLINFPKGYDAPKAVVNAINMIKQDPKASACTPESIGQSVRNMVYMGLDMSNKQCYPIPYNNKLSIDPSYFGSVTMVKRIKGVKDVVATVIFQDDEFEYEYDKYGSIIITSHKPKLENRDNDIVGAYATIILDKEIFGREMHVEVMTQKEIKTAWGQGATKGGSPAHKNFAQEMSKKTVLQRASKMFIRTLTDSTYVEMFNAMDEEDNKRLEAEYTENVREEALKIQATPVEEIIDVKAEEYSVMMDNLETESEF